MKKNFLAFGLCCALLLGGSPIANAQSLVNGTDALTVDADESIEWHRDEKAYVARGNAVAAQGDFSVRANILTAFYRESAGKDNEIFRLTAEGGVVIKAPEQTAYGDKGVYDLDREVAVLTGRNLRIEMAQDKVTAEKSIEFWQKERLAVARGNATAYQGENVLKADKLVASFEEGKDGSLDIERVDAEGNVLITTKRDTVRGDKGIYDFKSQKAVLTGNVRITSGGNQLSGDRAEVDMETGISRLLSTGSSTNSSKGRVRALIRPGQQPEE